MNDLFLDAVQLARLRALGTVILHHDTIKESRALRRVTATEIAVIDGFKLPVTRAIIESGADLRLLVLTSTAFHMVDLGAAREQGVRVANIPGYSTEAVAEHAFALLFAVA